MVDIADLEGLLSIGYFVISHPNSMIVSFDADFNCGSNGGVIIIFPFPNSS